MNGTIAALFYSLAFVFSAIGFLLNIRLVVIYLVQANASNKCQLTMVFLVVAFHLIYNVSNYVKLVRGWCKKEAVDQYYKIKKEYDNDDIEDDEFDEFKSVLHLWEQICKQKLPGGVWGSGKPKAYKHSASLRDGNCNNTHNDDDYFDNYDYDSTNDHNHFYNNNNYTDNHQYDDVSVNYNIHDDNASFDYIIHHDDNHIHNNKHTEHYDDGAFHDHNIDSPNNHFLNGHHNNASLDYITYNYINSHSRYVLHWIYNITEPDHNCIDLHQHHNGAILDHYHSRHHKILSTTSTMVPTTGAPHQCVTCNEYSRCEINSTIPGVCEKCACPLGRTGPCCETIIDLCLDKETNPCTDDTDDMHRACQVIRPAGNTKCVCEFGWKGRNCTEEYDPCKEHSCVNNGKCVPDENDEKDYRCECPYDFLGDYCQNQRPCHPKCEPCTKMAHMCKNNSTCWPGDTLRDGNFQCICKKGYEGQFCDLEIPCEAYNPCKNGGDCYREDGEVVCECLSIWTGPTCEIFNICHDDKCVNGICNAVGETNYTCACWKGYTGDHCEIKINECERDPYPCMNNGSCIDKIADYECSCPVGTSGKSCEHNFDDCADPTRGITNRCSKRDKKAICHDGINEFKCECSPDWTGETCSMRLMIYEILKHFNSYDEGLVQMLEDLIEKPELIKETLPFFLALMPPENQTKISWDHEDIFEWASFEGAELNLKKDIVKWNGATLGNCFTFNHDSRPQKFPLHYGGEKERFQAMMRVRQDEYLDWIDTSSLLVFVHSSKESVFGESVRFQAMPGGKTNIMTSLTAFERLGGKYGKCASDRSEVNSYYYSGEYTTDGCLRSCYQDAVFEACNCMDPRFPIAEGVRACDLGRRSCVVNVTQHRGDPSNWPDCECPPPCSNGQHNVRWSYAPFIKEDCSAYTGNNATLQKCLAKADSALISVYMPHIIQNTFKEEAKMDFNKFISMLGGLLGVLCGVCIITLAEFLLLIVEVVVCVVRRE